MIALADGTRLAYDDVGTGTPLLFLHGFPHRRTLWAPQLGAMMQRARCIAPDQRGFGESPARGPYSMDRWADDAIELLDALEVRRAVLCGLSMGGYIALAAWRRHPGRIAGLVLSNTRAGADSSEGRERRDAMIALAREKGAEAVADAMIVGMVGRTTRERNPALVVEVHAMLASASVEGIVAALEALRDRVDSTPTLPTIDVPTLVIAGDEDALVSLAEARAMHAAIAGSRLEVIAGAGHVSNVERPATYNHALADFLASIA